jgi:hypothetical protein
MECTILQTMGYRRQPNESAQNAQDSRLRQTRSEKVV